MLNRSKNTSTETISGDEANFVKIFTTYCLVQAFILLNLFSISDAHLLIHKKGFNIPIINTQTSVVGFLIFSSFVISIISIYISRECYLMEWRCKIVRSPSKSIFSFKIKNDTNTIILRCVVIFSVFFSGPLTTYLLLIRLSDYQSKVYFLLQLMAFVICLYSCGKNYKSTLHLYRDDYRKSFHKLLLVCMTLHLYICVDTIFISSSFSPIFYIKQNSALLDDEDGGTVWFIPHIKIDRTEKIYTPDENANSFALMTGYHEDVYNISRSISLDLRSRSLKYLDLWGQSIPRVWAHDSDLSGANLSFARLMGTNFVNTNLHGVNFSMSVLDGSSFFNSNIESVIFNNTHLIGYIFSDTQIRNSILIGSTFLGSQFYGSNIERSKLYDNDFNAIGLFDSSFSLNNFSNQKISYVFTSGEANDNTGKVFKKDEIIAKEKLSKYFCTGHELSITKKFSLYSILSGYNLTNERYAENIHDYFNKDGCRYVRQFTSKIMDDSI